MSTPAPLPRPPRPRLRLGIGGRLVALHVLILCVLTALLAVIQIGVTEREARSRLGERALGASRMVAALPQVVAGAERGTPDAALNRLVNRLREGVGADFIVVGDRRGLRLAHPRADRLGKPMEGGDNAEPLAGREIVSVAVGSLGPSVRGKVPIRAASGEVVGVVSTGYLLPRVRAIALGTLRALLPWFLVALTLGSVGAVLVARLLKRAILNLEPEQIGALVREQRAVLAALREGVLAVDADGRVVLANTRAAESLGRGAAEAPFALADAWPELAALAPAAPNRPHNLELRLRGVPVLVNLEPLEDGGFVATVRDRREAVALAEELTQVRGFVDVLRAQTHEYVNRLHTLSGLLQLGRPEDALRVLRSEIEADATLRELLRDVQAPRLVALLVGKRERAQELGLEFRVEPGSSLSARWDRATDALVTAVGNLTENAFEALRGRAGLGTVRVLIGEDPDGVQVEVMDDGPGVPPELRARLFSQGATTRGEGRGYGLANVRWRVEALGGEVRHFRRDGWTVFQVSLPTGAVPTVPEQEGPDREGARA